VLAVADNAALADLTARRTYYFRLAAGSRGGTARSAPQSFTTLAEPYVAWATPSDNAANVPLDSPVVITFSEAMASGSITSSSVVVSDNTGTLFGSLLYTGTTAIFGPAGGLTSDTEYTVRVTTAATSAAGVPIDQDNVWHFRTVDLTPPRVTGVSPDNNATGIGVNAQVVATFSEAIDPASVSDGSIVLQSNGNPIAGTMQVAGNQIAFTPASRLPTGAPVVATVVSGIKDLAGNALFANYSWQFGSTQSLWDEMIWDYDNWN
jgi:hypothetical protein